MSSNTSTDYDLDPKLELELINGICDRLSHSLRTPLGVGLSLLDDLQRGNELSQADKDDGKNALERISNILDNVKYLSFNSSNFEKNQTNREKCFLSDIVREVGNQLHYIHPDLIIDIENSTEKRALDKNLITNLIVSLYNYCSSFRNQNSKSLSLKSYKNCKGVSFETLTISVACQELAKFILSNEQTSWRNLSRNDKRVESLFLRFAHNAILLHQGTTSISISSNKVSFTCNI